MASPSSTNELLELVRKSGIYKTNNLDERLQEVSGLSGDPVQSAAVLVQHGLLTRFQAKLLLTGRYKGFRLGAYVIREQLGQGGMGAVYLAEHETLRRRVALKVLTPPKDNDQGKLTVERFLREARAAAALDHPNIVRIHDVAQQGEVHYLVMEYVDGQTLDALLEKGGPITPSRAVGYIAQAAAGLQHAHEKGFVHRDIKPANLILAKDGTVKILDMGLARSFTAESDKLTEVMDQGAILGTADFISPEQAMNAPGIDIRADIYSLGATFFAAVTGKPPFSGNTTQKLIQHQMKDAPDLTTLDRTFPPELAAVVARMLHKKPERRYQTPAEVISALAPWLSDDGGTKVMAGMVGTDLANTGELKHALTDIVGGTKRVGTRKLAAAKDAQNKWLWAGVGTAVLLAVGVLGYAVSGGGRSTDSQQQQQPFAGGPTGPAPTTTPRSSNPYPASPPPNRSQPRPSAPATRPASTTFRPAPAAGVIYRTDFAGMKPARTEARGKSNYGSKVGKEQLPDGWYVNHYRETAHADYLVGDVAGARALGIRHVGGTIGAQLSCKADALFNKFGPGDTVTLRVTYLYDGTGTAYAAIQQNVTPYKKHVHVELPPTNGEWRQVELSFTRPDADPLAFIFNLGLHGVSAEDRPAPGTVWVKAVEASVGPAEKVIYALDLSAQKPFTLRGRAVPKPSNPKVKVWEETGKTGEGTLPEGWAARPHNPKSEVEYIASADKGAMALGMRTVQAPGSAMLFMPQFDAPAGKVRVRFDYLTEGGSAKDFTLRFLQKKPEHKVAWTVQPIEPTGGQWKTVEADVDLKGATGGFFEFHNNAAATDVVFWLRGLTVSDPPAAAAAVTPPVYHADFAALQPAAEEVRRRNEYGNQLGGQPLPPGWGLNHYNRNTDSDYLIADVGGARALGLKWVNGEQGTQVMARLKEVFEKLAAGETAVIRIEYQCEGAGGQAAVQLDREPWTKDPSVELTPTNGQWKTAELRYTRQDTETYALIINTGTGGTLWVKAVDAWIGDPQPAAPPATAGPPPGRDVGPVVYAFDAAALTPGRYTVENRNFNGDNFFPEHFLGHCWKAESVTEFRCEDVAGSRAFGITNLNDNLSSQVLVYVEKLAQLTPGKEYRLRVEYRMANDAEGAIVAREPGPSYRAVAHADLTRGGTGWKAAEVTFRRPDDKPVELMFENKAVGEGNTVWVRKLEVAEVK